MLKYIVVLLFLVSGFALAQEIEVPEPCTPDCSAQEWSPVQETIVDLCCLGEYKIHWVYRFACNGAYQDFQLLRVEMLSNKGWSCRKGNCTQGEITQEDRYKAALKGLIALNPMGFNPIKGTTGCNSTWRISSKTCWADFEIYIFNSTEGVMDTLNVLVACDSSSCCMTNMKVCRTVGQNGKETIELTNLGPIQNVTCDTEMQVGSQIQSCIGVCDWLFPGNDGSSIYEYEWEESKWDIIIPKKANESEDSDLQFGINLFNSKTELSMEIYSSKSYSTVLEIFNIQGKLVLEKDINLVGGVQKIILDNSSFNPNQVYIYNFTYNGLLIKNGKFIK